ncbi:hypothetical protein [Streptomyces bambusae]|uniref:Uncharacterized protein n=1 Tax=Streptomyces bambusae TaxID=1550616 RepID=A0ABS6ZC12_9ACTN|nr:hypothetical protein [Streptomyces bambusae]MBW5485308.1 hypothetical protein [Streptomyces bambusae]
MDEQGGAGGIPLDDDAEASRRRRPHVAGRRDDLRTPAADTDEASRLDRPQEPKDPREDRVRWTSPRDRAPDAGT